jgi:hypothetical protein
MGNPFGNASLHRTINACLIQNMIILARLCGLVVTVPGYRSEMYCAFCEVRTEFIHVM